MKQIYKQVKFPNRSRTVILRAIGLIAATGLITGCSNQDGEATGANIVSSSHDSAPPNITEHMAQPSILVFSKTLDWRHNVGIAGADAYFARYSRQNNMGLFTTENGAVFTPEHLARFQLVVLNNVTGDALSPNQEQALQDWVFAGGGVIALHGTGDSSHDDWPWLRDTVIWPRFTNHPADPQFQTARLEVLDKTHPVVKDLPSNWQHEEEWYSFDTRAQDKGMRVLIGVDESTYSPQNLQYGDVSDLRMGEGAINHPLVWVNCHEK